MLEHAGTTPARTHKIGKGSWGPRSKDFPCQPTKKSLFSMEKVSIKINTK